MIEIFKTSVKRKSDSHKIVQDLKNIIPEARINFDLEDCDNILRIEANHFDIKSVQSLLQKYGHESEVLIE